MGFPCEHHQQGISSCWFLLYMDAIELGFSTHQTFSRMNSQFFKNPLSEENLKSTKISFPLNSKKNEGGGKSCYKNDEQQTDEERWWFSKTFRWTVCLVIRSMKCCIRRQLLNQNHRRGDATSSWGLKIEAQIMIWRLQQTVFRITWIKVKFMQLQWSHDEGNKKWNENFVRMGRHTKAGV